VYACAGTTKSACVAEGNCFWAALTYGICGNSGSVSKCFQCNATTDSVRAALANSKGKTCSFNASNGFNASSLTVSDLTVSTATSACPVPGAADMSEPATLTLLLQSGSAALGLPKIVGADAANGNCMTAPTPAPAPSAAESLLPGMAFLALIAVLA